MNLMINLKQVSFPGSPVKNPLKRLGKWPVKEYRMTDNWRYVIDKESHIISEQQTPNHKLTGESVGRQIWSLEKSTTSSSSLSHEQNEEVVFSANRNPNASDKLMRNQLISRWKGIRPDITSKPKTAKEAAYKGMQFFQMVQSDDGHWGGDYGGPMFLMPGLICTLYITKVPYPAGCFM